MIFYTPDNTAQYKGRIVDHYIKLNVVTFEANSVFVHKNLTQTDFSTNYFINTYAYNKQKNRLIKTYFEKQQCMIISKCFNHCTFSPL